MQMNEATTLYRHFDKQGELLYVGITNQPSVRLTAHGNSSEWAKDIDSVKEEIFRNRPLAMEAERLAIISEKPVWNRCHNEQKLRRGTSILDGFPELTAMAAESALPLPEIPEHAKKIRMQRLTLDMPASLHQAIKYSCTMRGTSIKDELVTLLRLYYPDKS